MRVVAGSLRGRAIVAPDDVRIRPTSDRVREAIFNVLEHGSPGVELAETRVIDLFAGTGALGIEALSRGAVFALLIDDDPAARALIRRNVEAFGLTGITKIWRRDATAIGPVGTVAPFGLAFLDPPYGKDLAEPALGGLVGGGWLKPGAIVVVEERADVEVVAPSGLELIESRTWGDTRVHFFRRA